MRRCARSTIGTMTLNPDDSRPPYQQLAAALREAIDRGEYPPGAQIPSGSELSTKYGVARATVTSALRLLRADGMIVSRQGQGVFVKSDALEGGTKSKGSPEFIAITERLDELARLVSSLAERVAELELVMPAPAQQDAGPTNE